MMKSPSLASKLQHKQGSKTRVKNNIESKRSKYGVIFALPWIIGLCAFYFYPLLSSMYYSFTNYNISGFSQFVGLQNYTQLFKDPMFWTGISNTFFYALMQLPLSVMLGVSIALLLNMKIKGQGIFRTLFFIPSLVPAVAVAILFQWLLEAQFGLVNYLLDLVGIAGPGWLGDPTWAKPSIVMMSLWIIGNTFLIYLAGLQDISQEYYDAAEVDGANPLRKIWHITLPLLTPVIFFNVVMGLINALQEFTLPYTLTSGTGSPADSLMFYSMYLYNNAFLYMRMGYASAMAWVLFILIMLITLIILKTSKRWVFYQGDN
ncbi:carbohydrate ABC transporter permease [Gracilibacillus alcaliphilus]|uniref:carbohydrate ABC transporter permease n=1 Tax=Gracilibacillus alcaliphilus TaxID=1401441 RepID=UPI001EF831B5|nr:sugar ABC transporter permease [Gracilibacillus alcaliphilus]MBM7677528.1 multiple sugar transport system permease protein [Gracilibacillus alcaliphilus]